jgi:formate dehydrogenase assembly factor FdhD
MQTKTKTPVDRRSGQDRRQAESDSPIPNERRVTIEPRQPEVVEIQVTPEEFTALGFKKPHPSAQ